MSISKIKIKRPDVWFWERFGGIFSWQGTRAKNIKNKNVWQPLIVNYLLMGCSKTKPKMRFEGDLLYNHFLRSFADFVVACRSRCNMLPPLVEDTATAGAVLAMCQPRRRQAPAPPDPVAVSCLPRATPSHSSTLVAAGGHR